MNFSPNIGKHKLSPKVWLHLFSHYGPIKAHIKSGKNMAKSADIPVKQDLKSE